MREERKQDTERHEDENKEGDRKSQPPLEFTIQKIHQKGVRKGKLRHLRKEKKRKKATTTSVSMGATRAGKVTIKFFAGC